METGFIKLYRKLLDWEWFDDHNTFRLFIFLLLNANHTDKNWRGIEIKRGQFLTSLKTLSDKTGLTIKQVRTSIARLKSTNEVAIKGHSRYTMITMVNWNEYQSKGQADGQAKGKQRATTKNDKNEKNILMLLNKLANKKFKPIPTNLDFITARLKEYTYEELERMVSYKVSKWKDDDKMSGFLRPSTLFNASKCAGYVEEGRDFKVKLDPNKELEMMLGGSND